jgi:predicted PurR-regulated permease PerM
VGTLAEVGAVIFRLIMALVIWLYLPGQLTLAMIIGVPAGVGTGLLWLPYAVVLGLQPACSSWSRTSVRYCR